MPCSASRPSYFSHTQLRVSVDNLKLSGRFLREIHHYHSVRLGEGVSQRSLGGGGFTAFAWGRGFHSVRLGEGVNTQRTLFFKWKNDDRLTEVRIGSFFLYYCKFNLTSVNIQSCVC